MTITYFCQVAAAGLVLAAGLQAQSYQRFANRWKPDQYIQARAGLAVAAPVESNAKSSRWSFNAVEGNYFQIRNDETGEYLHVERGRPEVGPIDMSWWSAQWVIEPMPGGFSRFKNRWTGKYLHIENGPLVSGNIVNDWWSAQWKVERWTTPAQTSQSTKPTSIPGAVVDARQQFKTITFRNEGGYAARFSLGYYFNNKPNVERTGSLAVGQSKSFEVPVEAQDIEVLGEYNNAISWKQIFKLLPGQTQAVIDPSPYVTEACVKTWGTVFSPQWGRCN